MRDVLHRVKPSFDKLDEQQEKAKRFGSAKFDILDAVAQDPRVTSGEFRVFFLLMQYARAADGVMFPSQERLAIQMNAKPRWVRQCIDGLVEKGWLSKSRPNRHRPNVYRVDTKNVNAVMDRITSLIDSMNERKGIIRDRQYNVSRNASERQDRAVPDRQDRAAKHLSRTPEYEARSEGLDVEGLLEQVGWEE